MINEILLRRKNKILVSEINNAGCDNIQLVVTMMKNISTMGFIFSEELIEVLRHCEESIISEFNNELCNSLQKMVGADHEYKPFYKNFPSEVMSMTDAELYFNAMIAYLTECKVLIREEERVRLPFIDGKNIKILDIGSEDELNQVFQNLITSKTSLSIQDKDDLKWFFENKNVLHKLPDIIPLKENVAFVGKMVFEYGDDKAALELSRYFKTATDVLRLITALSDGDISLAENVRFRNFRRKERRFLLQLLENCNGIEEDMLRYKKRWIRIGEIIHPSEFKEYIKVNVAFDKLRNDKTIENFNSNLQSLFNNGRFLEAAHALVTRPGEFARKLDYLLRNTVDQDQYSILMQFESIADRVAVPILLNLIEHYKYRNEKNECRVFFPKGSVAKAFTVNNELMPIDNEICNLVVITCQNALLKLFKEKEKMGKVYISSSMKQFMIPRGQRSATPSMKNISRGSRLVLEENKNYWRGFIWWTNTKNKDFGDRVDIDLSASILREDFSYLSHVSYTNLKDNKINCCSSGDITDGKSVEGDGVAEFVDIDMNSIVKAGGRYVICQVYSYSGQPFNTLENCSFGWMMRQDVMSGEIFEPATVEQKSKINVKSTVYIPCILDCAKKEIIWLDICMNIAELNYSCANLEKNLKGVSAVCYGILNEHKPSLYDLIILNAKCRGELVTNRNEADWIFDTDMSVPTKNVILNTYNEQGEIISSLTDTVVRDEVRIISPYELEVFSAELM